MDFTPDPKTEHLREQLLEFMDSHVYPAEPVFHEQAAAAENRWDRPPIMAELTREARRRGLWNLFLPDPRYGPGLSHAQYAPLAEITGRSPLIAPEALNCAAPDTGNMELLAIAATEQQRQDWLQPLLDGRIRSAFCMTEPEVASSDATNISTRIVPDGDGFTITGRKWWSTGALAPQCELLIVMGVTDPDAPAHRRQSIVLVPRDTPGVEVLRGLDVFGFDDGAHGGHAEIVFDGARIPAENLLGERGGGFALAQARLGPGRIHHCMRLIGMAERALELMCDRANRRVAFGKPLADQGVVRHWIAESRVRIEQLRLLTLKAAWMMDTVGAKAARTEISAIKIAAPGTAEWIIDKAVQVHGGAGVSQDLPLAMLWAQARYLRLADGPDEVHRDAVARRELAAR
ncbi:acyl-CoA dehydrogenase family protein (plasmid) [Pseudonocardia bannensis]|uniref:Acyl-CoA dehydrogenase n=1 Tax=Pseudonocardia bannensis TaxID=630973 RepID=A0A848DRN9_9PSEU|nr:acyl-CoA dehydrogenase family protein [Pseudonocardia bannensis]NMH95527.1 acyl-CoA dehydrogenase [Pseudonocardia bannensis]